MKKLLVTNIFILLLTYVLPLWLFRLYQDDYQNVYLVQESAVTVLFLGAISLTYINNKNRLKIFKLKWLWIAFEVLGIVGIIYSGAILYIFFAFRNGINF